MGGTAKSIKGNTECFAVSVERQEWDNGELLLELKGMPGTAETYWIYAPTEFIPKVAL